MAFKLSNDAPTMPKTFLEHILSTFEVWSTSAKNAILPDFGDFWWKFTKLPEIINFVLSIAETF